MLKKITLKVILCSNQITDYERRIQLGIKSKWTKFTALMVVVCFVFSVSAFAVESTETIPNIAVANAIRVFDNCKIVSCDTSHMIPLLVENVKSDSGQTATMLVYYEKPESAEDRGTPRISDDRERSAIIDWYYFTTDGKLITTYKIYVKGVCSNNSSYSQITSVSFEHQAGLTSTTKYKINGNTATLSMQPPGYPLKKALLTLSNGGAFSLKES